MGYREEGVGVKWKQKEKAIYQESAWNESSWALTVPSSSQQAWLLHFPHVLESFSSKRSGKVAMPRLLSGPGKRLFSQLLVTSVQYEGEGAPGLWNVFQGAEKW